MPVYDIAARKKKNLLPSAAEDVAKAAQDEEAEYSQEEEEEVDMDDDDVRTDSDGEGSEEHGGAEEPLGKATAGAAASPAAAAATTTVEFSEPAQWVERMALTSTRSLPGDLNADDDPKREEAFIQQTLLSVTRGISLLEEAKVPWKRPDDYYAEMYKSDTHMTDVRQAMEASKSRIEAQAHRRTMKEQKKYGKEVQAEVMRQRAKYKRDLEDSLSDWRKKRRGNNDSSLRGILDDEDEGNSSRGAKRAKGQRQPHARNMRPGGAKRPGKNARRRS